MERLKSTLDSSTSAIMKMFDLDRNRYAFVAGEKVAVTKLRKLLRDANLPYKIGASDSIDFIVPLNFAKEGRRQRVFLKMGKSEESGKAIISMESVAVNKPGKPSPDIVDLCKNKEANQTSGWRTVDAGKEFMLQRMTICPGEISADDFRSAVISCATSADDMEIKLSEKDQW